MLTIFVNGVKLIYCPTSVEKRKRRIAREGENEESMLFF